jgi:hypothetical protein
MVVLLLLATGWANFEPAAAPAPTEVKGIPAIVQSFAPTQIRPGDVWKVYLKASNPEGKMKYIFATISQPGIPGYRRHNSGNNPCGLRERAPKRLRLKGRPASPVARTPASSINYDVRWSPARPTEPHACKKRGPSNISGLSGRPPVMVKTDNLPGAGEKPIHGSPGSSAHSDNRRGPPLAPRFQLLQPASKVSAGTPPPYRFLCP